jgi:hypothetical protein
VELLGSNAIQSRGSSPLGFPLLTGFTRRGGNTWPVMRRSSRPRLMTNSSPRQCLPSRFGPTTPTHSRVVRRDATIHESIAPKESRHGDNRDAGRSQAGPVPGIRPPWYLRAGEALRRVVRSAYSPHSDASEHNLHYQTLQSPPGERGLEPLLRLASHERASCARTDARKITARPYV